jgi:PPE family.
MPNDYPSTQVPFDQLDLPRLHDPIVLGPGSGSMEGAADAYRHMAETLENAARDVRAVLTSSMGAHEGDAAEAGREYIRRVAAAGEAGGAAARLAMYALQEQVSYYSRVRQDMEAVAAMPPVPERKWQIVKTTPEERDAPRIMAVDAAHRYENNTNHNLANVYQMFEPPAGSGLEVAAVPPHGTPARVAAGSPSPRRAFPDRDPTRAFAPPPSPPGPPGTGPDGLPPNTSRPGRAPGRRPPWSRPPRQRHARPGRPQHGRQRHPGQDDPEAGARPGALEPVDDQSPDPASRW